LALFREPLHALPVAAHRELAQRRVLAQQAKAPSHDASASLGADHESPSRTLGALAVFEEDAAYDAPVQHEVANPRALTHVDAALASPLEQQMIETLAADREAGRLVPAIAALEARAVRRGERHPPQRPGVERLKALGDAEVVKHAPRAWRDALA